MKIKVLALAGMVAFSGCSDLNSPDTEKNTQEMKIEQGKNELAGMTEQDMRGFQWMNPPGKFQVADNALHVVAGKGTDFFNNPENGEIAASAPLLFREVSGDFVATTLVRPDFSAMWNAAALLVHADSTHWIKFAFENSDATGKSIVTVVTRGVSDDANGAVLHQPDAVWLKMIRKGNLFAMHWSEDGEAYKMARLSHLPVGETVKIGMEAQCPAGEAATHEFLFFSLGNKTVEDLRKGE